MEATRRFFIETFGCQMNQFDSEKISGLLANRGLIPARSPDEADVLLFNTCSIRDKAVQKVYSRLIDLKARKRERGGNLIVGVLGCAAQQEGEKLVQRTGVVDLVAGPQKVYKIPFLIERAIEERRPIIDTDEEEEPLPAEIEGVLRENRFRAMVTIMEGCDNSCTFCVVPFTRGRAKHRPSYRIINEVRELAARGYVEIVLLGQNVNSYRDPSPAGLSFADLLRAVGSVEGIRRVRFVSPHPKDFTQDVVRAIDETPAICNQVHMPAQSGSTRVLKMMNRGYTREGYLEKVRLIRGARRPMAISTDIIVGFPGETEDDFNATLDLIERVRYDSVFSFKYSPRPNTEALRLGDDVPEDEKSRRLEVLQDRQRQIQAEINRGYIGKVVEVLVESRAKARYSLSGRTPENKVVNFDGPADLVGRFVEVRITDAGANSLQGELVGPLQS